MAIQLKRTYAKSSGWRLIPSGGGAIQFAYLPGSVTQRITDATNARSSGVASQRRWLAAH